MSTPIIQAYYNENDPMKRRALLEQSIEAGEEPEANEIRMRLWDMRYKNKSDGDKNNRADGYLALWMSMEFNRHSSHRLFGAKSAKKTILKDLERLNIPTFRDGSELEQELLYQELCHMVKLYIELSQNDRSYNSYFGGLIGMKSESAKDKLQADVYETGIGVIRDLELEEEMGILCRAVREVYRMKFPGEETLEEREARKTGR